MFTICIQAQNKQMIIKVMTLHSSKPFEIIHSDVSGPFSMPTFTGYYFYVRFMDHYTCYTSVWVPTDKKSKICIVVYQSFQARVDSLGHEVKQFRCIDCHQEYDIVTFRLVLAAHGSTYKQYPADAHRENSVAESTIQTSTENARSMMIDSPAPLLFWGEAVNTTVYLHLSTPNKALTKRDDCNGYPVPYSTP